MTAELSDFVAVVYIIQNIGLWSSIKSGASHLHLTLILFFKRIQQGGRFRSRETGQCRARPDLSTAIDYVLFTFHCFDVQSGQVFY